MLADGTIASSGGKVVKNVAGYDLGKLFCGSRGRLGLIARVALRLHPRPEAEATLAVVETAEDAAARARAILRAQLARRAVDVLRPGWLCRAVRGRAARGGRAAAHAQALVGGSRTTARSGRKSEARQTWARGRLRFAPAALAETLAGLDAAVVRVAAGVAYVEDEVEDPRDPAEVVLAERVRAQFDPARGARVTRSPRS